MLKSIWLGVLLGLVAEVAAAPPQRTEFDVADPEGNVVAQVVLCNDCKDPARPGGATCADGAAEGWRGGSPCGSCLLRSNWGVLLEYAYDLHVAGILVGADGKPVVERYVKMFLPNGWSIRTRTLDDGSFRLMLGATLDRKSRTPMVVDIGERVDQSGSQDPHFAIYLLPKGYKPCTSAEPMEQRPSLDGADL